VSPRTEYNRDDLFQPDSMLPEQFFATLRSPGYAKRGEYLLVAAVLEDAIHCYKKYVHARDREGRRLFEEANAWFMAERNVPHAGVQDPPTLSFEYVCDVLGLNPVYLRTGLSRWRERQSAPVVGRAVEAELSAA
jgi:hypothetical protein